MRYYFHLHSTCRTVNAHQEVFGYPKDPHWLKWFQESMAVGIPLFLKIGFIRKVTDQYSLELEDNRTLSINSEGDQLKEEVGATSDSSALAGDMLSISFNLES